MFKVTESSCKTAQNNRLRLPLSNYNFKLVSEKIDNSGTLSKNDFWKNKKKLFPKSQSVLHAVLDKLGNELTEPQNIILAYHNQMFHRLQKRLIRDKSQRL